MKFFTQKIVPTLTYIYIIYIYIYIKMFGTTMDIISLEML